MIRRVLMTSAVALVAAFSIRFAAANGQLLTTEFAVELTCGKTLPVSTSSSAILAESALKLVESSEYNSHSPRWHFPMSELQEEYHRALASAHIRVVFDQVQTMESRSGRLRMREVIIRLGPEGQATPFPDRFVDSVFTIDDRGEVVGFALYNGVKAIALWRAVTQTTGSENACRLPTHVPGVPTGGRAASSLTGAS